MPLFFRTYRIVYGKAVGGTFPINSRIDGVFTLVFIHDRTYYLQPMYAYQDGVIDCRGLVDFEGFTKKVRSGWVLTRPPSGALVEISDNVSLKATDVNCWLDPEDLIREVADQIELLNDRPIASDRCRVAWAAYERKPSDENKKSLQSAYEAI